jgi:rhomboid protease GluP
MISESDRQIAGETGTWGRRPRPGPAPTSLLAPEMQALLEIMSRRRAVAVSVILLLNIAVFVALEATGGSSSRDNLIRFGAKYNDLILQGEYWRLVTCLFLHIGFAHLLFNSLALWSFGRDLEKLYGSGKFVVIYLLAGIAGSFASYRFSPDVSAGASGAIFGLIGLSLVFGFRYRSAIPPRLKSRFGSGVVPVIVYNILFGLRPNSHIDNFAHMGGLAAGILLGLVIPAGLESSDDPLVR